MTASLEPSQSDGETGEPGVPAGVRANGHGPARDTARRFPDFYIVGHPKSGTTALYEMLRRHPDIFMPDYKEPRYFLSDLPSLYIERKGGAAPLTVEDYLDAVRPGEPGQLLGEASTAYIWSKTSAELIAAARPDARIIVILREPASFVRSLHLQLLQIRVEKEKNLRDALALEDARARAAACRGDRPLAAGAALHRPRPLRRAAQALSRTCSRRSRCWCSSTTTSAPTTRATVREVLEVPGRQRLRPGAGDRGQPDGAHALGEARRGSARGDPRAAAPSPAPSGASVKALTPRSVRRGAHSAIRSKVVFGAPRPPDEALMRELRLRFKGEVEALSEYMDRDLVSLWGYDDLD